MVAAAAVLGVAAVRDWTGGRWLVIHLFFAGGVVLAISGVSQMLTITWSASPAPSDRWTALQRWCIAIGAAGVGIGHHAGAVDAVVGAAAGLHLVGLVLLGVLLVRSIRRGVERRFDAAVAAYVAALAAGTVGVTMGAAMATGAANGLRDAHLTANLFGLVGLVVGGTMPYFVATVVRSKMSARATRPRLFSAVAWQAAMVTVAVAASLAELDALAAAALGGYALGIVAILAMVPTPTRRQLEWAGPRLVAVWAGGAWWTLATAATAVDVAAGSEVGDDPWLGVLAVAAFAQILWGSLAYLLPMLRGGGHQRLSEGFATTRSWVGLAAVNVAGVGLAGSWHVVAGVALALWVLDAAWRAVRVGVRRAERAAAV